MLTHNPFTQGLEAHAATLVWQNEPKNPDGQVQVYCVPMATQVAPFLHWLFKHGLVEIWQFDPTNPAKNLNFIYKHILNYFSKYNLTWTSTAISHIRCSLTCSTIQTRGGKTSPNIF